jgi:hypothetical protein
MTMLEPKVGRELLHAPKPTQNIDRENSNAGSGGNSRESLLSAGFTVSKSVPPDHNGNQTGNLRNGSREERLKRIETSVEGTSLGTDDKRYKQHKSKQ